MDVKREIELYCLKRKKSSGFLGRPGNDGNYYNITPIILPDNYNPNNIICQFLTNHHTKREFTPFKSRH